MLFLESLAEFFHFLQRRCNQAANADKDWVVLHGSLENCLARHHNSEVDHFETIARKHDSDDVFADIMYVSICRSKHYARFCLPFFAFVRGIDVGLKQSHGVLHDLS